MSEKTDFKASVLEIDTTASVVLARKSISLEEVLSLTSGTMLPFEKGCDEPLVLEVGKKEVALGEAVKVGDKFGLRIRNILADDQ